MSRCTCYIEEQPTSRPYKLAAVVIIAVACLGISICTSVAYNGFIEADKGVRNAECTSVRFLSTSLNGQQNQEPHFIGILPLLDELKKVDEALDLEANTGLAREIEGILDKTDSIKRYVDLTRETLKLLKATTALNLEPKNSGNQSMFHDCLLCKVLQDKAQMALAALDNSIASKLALSREDVNAKTTPEYKARMHKDLEDIRKAVVQQKIQIRDGIAKMLDTGSTYRKVKETGIVIKNVLLAVVMMGTVLATLLVCCAGVSTYRFMRHEMDPEKDELGKENPYNEKIHWYAGSTWWYGFFYMVVMLASAGIIFGAASIGSGACLLANDLDSDLLQQMGPILGVNEGSTEKDKDEFEIMKALSDKCLRPKGQDGPVETYLFDILYTREGGKKVTQREKLQRSEENAKQIFSHITEHARMEYIALATMPDIRKLLDVLKFHSVRDLLVGNVQKITADATRGVGDARLEPSLKGLLGCSLACANKTLGNSLGEYSMTTTIGMEAFSSRLSQMGTSTLPHTHGCIKKVACNPSLEYHRGEACKAGNNYLGMKEQILSMETFRCDLFERPDSPTNYCDPLDMQCKTVSTTTPPAFARRLTSVCTGDVCLNSDGKATPKRKACKLEEFNQYVSDYHGRLDKLIKLVDNAVVGYKPSIENTMDLLLATHGASRAQSIANSVTCNFVAGYYQELIDGTCYQGVWGARRIAQSYVGMAIMTAFLVITMYAVWCRARSNHKYWTPDRTKFKAKVAVMDAKARGKKDQFEEGEFLLGGREVKAPTQIGPPKTRFSDVEAADSDDS